MGLGNYFFKREVHRIQNKLSKEGQDFISGTLSWDIVYFDKVSSLDTLGMQVPFSKSEVKTEKILFVDIPVRNKNVDLIYSAHRFGRAAMLIANEYGAIIDGKIPSSWILKTNNSLLGKHKYVSPLLGEDDIFLAALLKDERYNKLCGEIQTEQRLGNVTISLPWALQCIPLHNNKICVLMQTGNAGVLASSYNLKTFYAFVYILNDIVSKLDYKDDIIFSEVPVRTELLKKMKIVS